MQGAVDPVLGPIGEKAEAVIIGIDGKKIGLLLLEHVFVFSRISEVGSKLGSLGQDLDNPLHLRGRNADLV